MVLDRCISLLITHIKADILGISPGCTTFYNSRYDIILCRLFFGGTWRKRKDIALTGKLKKKGVITNSKAVAMVNTGEIAQARKVSKREPKKPGFHL